jgi:inner membrane protein
LYVVLYGVLQSEDNALLMGALIMFSALAAVMLLTRNMNWYELNNSTTSS